MNEEQAEERDITKPPRRADYILRAEIDEENLWLESLENVADNDSFATQNWFIPLQLLEYVGFDVEDVKEYQEKMSQRFTHDPDERNERINIRLREWIRGRLEFNQERLGWLPPKW